MKEQADLIHSDEHDQGLLMAMVLVDEVLVEDEGDTGDELMVDEDDQVDNEVGGGI